PSSASVDTDGIPGKARRLVGTADGSALLGWLVNEDWQTDKPREPDTALSVASARISAFARTPRHSLMVYAFVLALLLTPLARGGALKAILFALVAMVVAWGQMAVTANA